MTWLMQLEMFRLENSCEWIGSVTTQLEHAFQFTVWIVSYNDEDASVLLWFVFGDRKASVLAIYLDTCSRKEHFINCKKHCTVVFSSYSKFDNTNLSAQLSGSNPLHSWVAFVFPCYCKCNLLKYMKDNNPYFWMTRKISIKLVGIIQGHMRTGQQKFDWLVISHIMQVQKDHCLWQWLLFWNNLICSSSACLETKL